MLGVGEDVASNYGEGLAGFEDAGGGDELFPAGRAEEVGLEFDRQNFRTLGHQGKSRVPARAVGDRRNDPGVDETMLLRQIVAERQHDLDGSTFHTPQLRPDKLHNPLPRKTIPETAFEIVVVILWNNASHYRM